MLKADPVSPEVVILSLGVKFLPLTRRRLPWEIVEYYNYEGILQRLD